MHQQPGAGRENSEQVVPDVSASQKPVLNPEMISEIKDLGDDVFQELVELYLGEGPGRLEKIKQGIAAGDAKETAQGAHSLKGSSSSFGAGRLAELSEKIETAGNAGDLSAAQAVVADLEAEYNKVSAALAAEAGL